MFLPLTYPLPPNGGEELAPSPFQREKVGMRVEY